MQTGKLKEERNKKRKEERKEERKKDRQKERRKKKHIENVVKYVLMTYFLFILRNANLHELKIKESAE